MGEDSKVILGTDPVACKSAGRSWKCTQLEGWVRNRGRTRGQPQDTRPGRDEMEGRGGMEKVCCRNAHPQLWCTLRLVKAAAGSSREHLEPAGMASLDAAPRKSLSRAGERKSTAEEGANGGWCNGCCQAG